MSQIYFLLLLLIGIGLFSGFEALRIWKSNGVTRVYLLSSIVGIIISLVALLNSPGPDSNYYLGFTTVILVGGFLFSKRQSAAIEVQRATFPAVVESLEQSFRDNGYTPVYNRKEKTNGYEVHITDENDIAAFRIKEPSPEDLETSKKHEITTSFRTPGFIKEEIALSLRDEISKKRTIPWHSYGIINHMIIATGSIVLAGIFLSVY
ncbi:hypothetical protein [Alteribacillus sp. HJP-4]|uniref:hypothetical protein n=1 Tax=Alteribacillus sp. HJP-4 TaxID=2775394 RepID=UPI0035CD3A73